MDFATSLPPHFYCFLYTSTTLIVLFFPATFTNTTAFLLFPFHHHHHHHILLFSPAATTAFSLFSLHHHHIDCIAFPGTSTNTTAFVLFSLHHHFSFVSLGRYISSSSSSFLPPLLLFLSLHPPYLLHFVCYENAELEIHKEKHFKHSVFSRTNEMKCSEEEIQVHCPNKYQFTSFHL